MKIHVNTRFNSDMIEQSIQNDTAPFDKITKQVIQLKEQGVIDALIALGWTPPKESIAVKK